MNNVLVIENLSDFLSHFIANTNFKINWDKLFGRVQMTDEFESIYPSHFSRLPEQLLSACHAQKAFLIGRHLKGSRPRALQRFFMAAVTA